MARMHTGKHGKSKSRKPALQAGMRAAPEQMSNEEIEKTIEGYAKQNMNPALIGQMLKDKHDVLHIRQATGKRLTLILKEKGLSQELPSDLLDLMKKAVKLRKHLNTNKQDVHNRTRLGRTESKIWRLGKYYKREGILPNDWKYDPEKAALIIKS